MGVEVVAALRRLGRDALVGHEMTQPIHRGDPPPIQRTPESVVRIVSLRQDK